MQKAVHRDKKRRVFYLFIFKKCDETAKASLKKGKYCPG